MLFSDKLALIAILISFFGRPIDLFWNMVFKKIPKEKLYYQKAWRTFLYYWLPIIIILYHWFFGEFNRYFVLNVCIAFSVLTFSLCLSVVYPLFEKITVALSMLVNKPKKE